MWEDIKNQIQQEIEEEMKAKEGDSDPPVYMFKIIFP